jgi:predicted short-subunit dehydrogenase-like oxidoreductase (DUF2520 family)
MNIVIIGTGNTATVLGRKFLEAGHTIVQVGGRDAGKTSALAALLKAAPVTDWNEMTNDADVYFLAVSDEAIEVLAAEIKLPGRVVAHTAASVSREVLKTVSPHYGVFYPLQTLRTETSRLPVIPVLIDGSDERTKKILKELATSISDVEVQEANDAERMKLHVAAVIVSNFTNYLYAVAAAYCNKEGLDFKQLLPLIEETALRLRDMSPHQAQTGPARRQDEATIQKHLALLEQHPDAKKLYGFLSAAIISLHRS